MNGSTLAFPQPLDRRLGRAAVGLHVVGRRTVVRVDGEIDIATAPMLAGAIDGALGGGAVELWIDLTPTSFMDSSGVHVLLEGQARACELKRRLAVICPDRRIRRLFDVAGVSDRLPVYEDRPAANRAS